MAFYRRGRYHHFLINCAIGLASLKVNQVCYTITLELRHFLVLVGYKIRHAMTLYDIRVSFAVLSGFFFNTILPSCDVLDSAEVRPTFIGTHFLILDGRTRPVLRAQKHRAVPDERRVIKNEKAENQNIRRTRPQGGEAEWRVRLPACQV